MLPGVSAPVTPQPTEPSAEEWAAGLDVARTQRVAIFVVAYNAEAHIRETLHRIPDALRPHLASVYVIDDKSVDRTTEMARRLADELPTLEVFTTPVNQGYGGNQKLGFSYAIRREFDVVVLLHGDGQYAPEALPRLLGPFADPTTAAVFGSRMMVRGGARRGGMPLYKYFGNRVLTAIENRLLGAHLTEFHSGYRAYRVSALAALPFRYNTNDFHFDTEIIIQLLARNMKIVEVPIPTYYGDEICHVEGIPYAVHCVSTVLRARANQVHLVHHPKFDVYDRGGYVFKTAPSTVHQHILSFGWQPGTRVLELGAGHGRVGLALSERGVDVVATDLSPPDEPMPFPYLSVDLDGPFAEEVAEAAGGVADVVLALDVIEHLHRPELSLQEIRKAMKPGGTLLASTGNVAYVLVRAMLALGFFNYGRKGILDLTHTRLFTIRSFCRTLEGEGFEVMNVQGFGPPIRDMIGSGLLWRLMDRVSAFLARAWPTLFAYQILVEARRLDGVDDILDSTVLSAGARQAASSGGAA
jgi:glycosyltransferase involved in cell wall biosynthesis/SAM-dependent methyltransferase